MKFVSSEKLILAVFLALFFTSATYLFWQNNQELNPDQDKNWWALSFAVPEDQSSLSFVIENHSDYQSFHYQIESDRVLLEERDIIIPSGSNTAVTPEITARLNARTNIIVTTPSGKKIIYR